MAAAKTVSQFPNSLQPRHGVVTLFGYGIQIRVDGGHLILEDGIGADRRFARLPRVGHGLKRLVVIGADGCVSLAALRWLADQDAAFIMLERNGKVLAATGPVRPSDVRLRRAQALANETGTALRIARELISHKLGGQEQVARDGLHNAEAAEMIARFRMKVARVDSLDSVRLLESQAAKVYWSAWRDVSINFPRKDLLRVPDHWRTFGTRISPLTGSPRLAANPPNAMLNYLYALLESESRLAAAALGLDPGLGVLHVDTKGRDSLACDLMEALRPQVDAWVLDWISREPLAREWFFEQRDGNCRLMASFAARLSETAPAWGRLVALFAEWVTKTLWATNPRPTPQLGPATRLTQARKREAKGSPSLPPVQAVPTPQRICRVCGKAITGWQSYCGSCATAQKTETIKEVGQAGRVLGRVAAQSREAQERRRSSRRRHALAEQSWSPSSQPDWLDEAFYGRKVQPLLAGITNSKIAALLGVSIPYASDIRAGRRRPHPRHWQALAELTGISSGG